ncbi:MAG: GIY-YIG nuclease family protein [Clostridiales bacterium]|nr:GIY-YIG nuclease family protein [Clostridiales bacterium]
MAFYVYMAQCADGTLYTGYTTDLARREQAHNAGKGAKYTRSRLPVHLVWAEQCPDKSAALRREWAVKRLTRREKQALIAAGGERLAAPTLSEEEAST